MQIQYQPLFDWLPLNCQEWCQRKYTGFLPKKAGNLQKNPFGYENRCPVTDCDSGLQAAVMGCKLQASQAAGISGGCLFLK
jgi:hypothetical protein